MFSRFFIFGILLSTLFVLNGCDSAAPPTLMKASKQFETDEIRDKHIGYMRKNHMDALKHKRDQTVYNGIRTEHHSLNACIDCHVPISYKGEILRHTNQEHFCTTCHTYVAEKLNCFECHVDHPVRTEVAVNDSLEIRNLVELTPEELMALAFKYSKEKPLSRDAVETTKERSDDGPKGEVFISMNKKPHKSRGVPLKDPNQTKTDTKVGLSKVKSE